MVLLDSEHFHTIVCDILDEESLERICKSELGKDARDEFGVIVALRV